MNFVKINSRAYSVINRILGCLILLLCSFLSFGQLTENFSDGDFTSNPTWVGTTADYIVNANGQLQLNNTVAGTSYLTTPHQLSDFNSKEWRFWVRQAFAGSGTNYGRIFLITNSSVLSTTSEGIYIQLGEAGSNDAVRLMQKDGATTTQICASVDGSIANSFAIGIRVVRSNSGTWSMYIDEAGGDNYQMVSSGVEAVIPVGDHFGYFNMYTATNANKFYLDNIYVGVEFVDTTPPVFSSVVVTDPTHLKLTFSEPISQSSAENLSNYTINPSVAISVAARDAVNHAVVDLTLADALTNGVSYNITANQIEDLLGNTSGAQDVSFTYLVGEVPAIGDVVINEFFPDPSPSVGLPEYEFVEIYNASTKIFNLSGWKLGDNSSWGTIGSGWLMPNSYAVLVPNANVSNFNAFNNVVGVTNFPSLNNASDEVKIQSAEAIVLDQLTYTLEWYHDESKQDGGWTIERINPSMNCSGIHNWKASAAAIGGTPGSINSVFSTDPDTTLPEISSINILGGNVINVQFSKGLDSASLVNAALTITPNLTVSSKVVAGNYPTLMSINFVEAFESGINYIVELANVQDCWGNVTNVSGQFLIPGVPAPGDIIINEFFADPNPSIGLPEIEFVELYNRSTKSFNVNGWKLGDNSSFGTVQNGWIHPGEYLVLCPAVNVNQYPNSVGVTSFPSLGNNGDDIIIRDNTNSDLDKISYTIDWYKDMSKKDGGWTIERINPEAPCSDFSNWTASISPLGGTPGYVNSVFNNAPDTSAPGIMNTEVINAQIIEIRFNKAIDSISLVNSTIAINPSLTVVSRSIPNSLSFTMQLTFSEDLEESETYFITMSNLVDCWGNEGNVQGEFARAATPAIGDVVINEILFDQYTGASDWVELYNNSSKLINLKGWKVARFNNGVATDFKEIVSNYFLEAGDYVVLGADSASVIANYPATVLGKFYQMALPTMSNDTGSVIIYYPLNDSVFNVMDQVIYSSKWHFKLIDSKDGKSLERRDPNAATQDAKNWYTAAEAVGFGTPGGKNSQYNPALYSGKISLGSETISPDNDGFEDALQINYQMDEAGMVATIKIFDDRGRIIKTLAKAELLGLEGYFVWDGVREDGLKASIGTYVVLFEAFDINGGNEFVAKKAFVVAGKF